MGYNTYYDLKVYKGEKTIQEILSELNAEGKFSHLDYYAVDDNGNSYEPCHWYDHELDMKGVSKIYPDTVFVLHGEGEESDDIWNKYFKNGKMQSCYAVITFEDFDEGKLE